MWLLFLSILESVITLLNTSSDKLGSAFNLELYQDFMVLFPTCQSRLLIVYPNLLWSRIDLV